MSGRNDTDSVLHRFITDVQAERLLAGHADTGDDGLASLAGLFTTLRTPSQAAELAGTDDLVARMTAAVRDGGMRSALTSRRKAVLAQVLTAKVAAFAAVALFTAGTAAAATGNLPGPLQRGVASTMSNVGVNLATPTDESTTTTTETPTSTTVTDTSTTTPTTASDSTTASTAAADTASDGAVGPDANGPAKHGLCTAYFAGNGHAKNPDAVAFRNLTDAAAAAGMTVDAFCTPTSTTTTTVTLTDLATADGTTTTDDATTIHGHGSSGSTPGATAPGRMTSPSGAHGKP